MASCFLYKRREFITLLSGAAAWPLAAARAQQATKLPTIGFLGSSTLSEASPWVSAFVERLRELGWSEGRNVAMAFRWAGGRSERYSEIATEFVGLKVDVIVTFGTPAALATKQVTAAVPIVIALAGDPVGGWARSEFFSGRLGVGPVCCCSIAVRGR